MTVKTEKWYKPRDIARLGLIKNSKGEDNESRNYFFILSLIKSGKLKAKNYGSGSRAYFLVAESEIQQYHQSK